MKFLLACAITFVSQTAWAVSIEGVIQKRGDQIFLRSADSNIEVEIKPANVSVEKDLSRLEGGDFLSGEGRIPKAGEAFYMSVVHFVGLQRILGTWYTANWDVFDFQNFSDLNLYLKKGPDNTPKPHHFSYSVSPGDRKNWSMMFIDDEGVELGQMEHVAGNMVIHILNPETGAVDFDIQLTQLVPKDKRH